MPRKKSDTTLTRLERQRAQYLIRAGKSDDEISESIGVTREAITRYRKNLTAPPSRLAAQSPLSARVWRLSIRNDLTPQQERFMAIYISEMAAVTRRKFSEADHLVRTTGLDANTATKARQVRIPLVDRKEIFGTAVSCAALSADDSA